MRAGGHSEQIVHRTSSLLLLLHGPFCRCWMNDSLVHHWGSAWVMVVGWGWWDGRGRRRRIPRPCPFKIPQFLGRSSRMFHCIFVLCWLEMKDILLDGSAAVKEQQQHQRRVRRSRRMVVNSSVKLCIKCHVKVEFIRAVYKGEKKIRKFMGRF